VKVKTGGLAGVGVGLGDGDVGDVRLPACASSALSSDSKEARRVCIWDVVMPEREEEEGLRLILLHELPLGTTVYVVEPEFCEKDAVTNLFEQLFVTLPPLALLVIERSYEGEVSTRFSFPEREMITLVAFSVTKSATDPEAMVSVVSGDVTASPMGEIKVIVAAFAKETEDAKAVARAMVAIRLHRKVCFPFIV
jgi:hypothetical protein